MKDNKNISEEWDKNTQNDWNDKMSEPIKPAKLSYDEYLEMKEKGLVN